MSYNDYTKYPEELPPDCCGFCGEHKDNCSCNDNLIIHDKCGLDVELCVCPDSKFYWDKDKGCLIERGK